ncbi:MAG: radical SAM protein [Kiritimatiellae bacterium]|nr:radical SAM protein [Kiritimatiellia bacterium]
MLLRLSRNAFVRQYGPFTYVLGRIRNFDMMFMDAEIFFRWLTRVPMEENLIVEKIVNEYSTSDRDEIERDFHQLMNYLIGQHIVVAGKAIQDLDDNDERFTYNVENPKTQNVRIMEGGSLDMPIPQDVLDKYFYDNPTIFTLQLDITQACTERCVHCYMPEYKTIHLPFQKIKEIIDEFRLQGGVQLSLSGGECMLHPNFGEIIEYARRQDLIVCVLSNLTLCDDKMTKILSDADVFVQVSLYSMNMVTHDKITRRKGSFRATTEAIERLRKANIPCFISCPTMKDNYKDYLDVLAYARRLKMDAQTDFIIMGKMNGDNSNLACRLNLEETRHILEDVILESVPMNSEYFNPGKREHMLSDDEWGKNRVCGACVSSICCDALGNYYPCPAFGGMVLGNCYEHDLTWVWTKSPNTIRIRNVKGQDFPKCLHCKERNYCSVCMCRNYNETGDMFTPSRHFCDVAKLNHDIVEQKQKGMTNAV